MFEYIDGFLPLPNEYLLDDQDNSTMVLNPKMKHSLL